MDMEREMDRLQDENAELREALTTMRAALVKHGVPMAQDSTDVELILSLSTALTENIPREVAMMFAEQRAKFLTKLSEVETERDTLLKQLREIDHKSMADTLERSNAVIAQYKAERDALAAWKAAVPMNSLRAWWDGGWANPANEDDSHAIDVLVQRTDGAA